MQLIFKICIKRTQDGLGSWVVSHPSTDRTQHCLTSAIGQSLMLPLCHDAWWHRLFYYTNFKLRQAGRVWCERVRGELWKGHLLFKAISFRWEGSEYAAACCRLLLVHTLCYSVNQRKMLPYPTWLVGSWCTFIAIDARGGVPGHLCTI